MKNIFLLFCFCSVGIFCNAQTESYYYINQNKIKLKIYEDLVYVSYSTEIDSSKIGEIANRYGTIKKQGNYKGIVHFYWSLIKIDRSMHRNLAQIIAQMKSDESIESIQPVVVSEEPIAVSNIFYIRLQGLEDSSQIKEFAKENNVTIIGSIRSMPLWIKLVSSKNSSGNSLELSNKAIESGKFADADPNFMIRVITNCSIEPDFPQQWGLANNFGGPDIKICKAWEKTKGNQNIKVAIVDHGIDQSHTEFQNNIVGSYDATTLSSPATILYGTHGTKVAGVVGANENNMMMMGVAPRTGLLSVNVDYDNNPFGLDELAEGIAWAWQNGADVINNSWGTLSPNLQVPILDYAISSAMTMGRNGLGSIVIFASGNDGTIYYPAQSNPDILTVGAIDKSGIRSTFSNSQSSAFGTELDVVAPGSDIFTTVPGNNTLPNSGTSYAAPHAAGVAALILAANPCLTREAVVGIIERTCQKISTGTYTYNNQPGRVHGSWNDELGYGLIDAGRAVDLARTLYLQNITEGGTENYLYYRVRAGKNVSPVFNAAVGPYVIDNGADVTIRAKEEISFEDGFEAKAGSKMNAFIETNTPNCNEWSPPVLARLSNANIAFTEVPNPITAVQLDDHVTVYPIPFREKLAVNFKLQPNSEARVILTDIYGKQHHNKTVSYTNGNEQLTLENLQGLSSGLYILTVYRGAKISSHKILKYE